VLSRCALSDRFRRPFSSRCQPSGLPTTYVREMESPFRAGPPTGNSWGTKELSGSPKETHLAMLSPLNNCANDKNQLAHRNVYSQSRPRRLWTAVDAHLSCDLAAEAANSEFLKRPPLRPGMKSARRSLEAISEPKPVGSRLRDSIVEVRFVDPDRLRAAT